MSTESPEYSWDDLLAEIADIPPCEGCTSSCDPGNMYCAKGSRGVYDTKEDMLESAEVE